MRQRGFTFIEVMVVMIIIGVIAAFGIPRFRTTILKQNVRSTRVAISSAAAKARASAVQRGCRAFLHFSSGSSGKLWVTVCSVNATKLDTLGGVDPLASRLNVTITATQDSIIYLPSGISRDYVNTVVRIVAGSPPNAITDSALINQVGKVVR
jgi:prepilin-type N-terminal cleavage/methylation domain-containing protein